MLTDEQGEILVKAARSAIESFLELGKVEEDVHKTLEGFSQPNGVFVTLKTYPDYLRGCIGFPISKEPLKKTLVDAAISAAFRDPRFKPLEKKELKRVTVEVSVLTEPEIIKVSNPQEYVKHIKVGRDGLVVKRGYFSGLLLPQVAPEFGWGAQELLERCCEKAGLELDGYKDENTEVYKFQAQVFSEEKPRGKIKEK